MDDLWAELQEVDAETSRRIAARVVPTQLSTSGVGAGSSGASRKDPTALKVQLGDVAKAANIKALALASSSLDAELDGVAERPTRSGGESGTLLGRTLSAASAAPTIRNVTEQITASATQAAAKARAAAGNTADGTAGEEQGVASNNVATAGLGAVPKAIDYEDDDDLAAALQRDISGLSDHSPVVRKACVARLCLSLFGHDMGLGAGQGSAQAAATNTQEEGQGQGESVLTQDVAAALAAVSALSTPTPPPSDPEEAAEEALRGTSHGPAVAGEALVPGGLQSMHIAMDPAYKYSAHELSDVAAMIVGRTASGEAARRDEGGLIVTTAAATGITRALAMAMRADPLRHWAAQAAAAAPGGASGPEGAASGQAATQHVRDLLRALWPRLQKPLLLCLGDAWEGVRLGALLLFSSLLSCGAVLDFPSLLPLLMPALVERAGLGTDSSWVFDPDQKVFARDVAAHDAYRRGRVLESHQGVLSLQQDGLHKRPVGEPSETGRAALARCVFALVEACSRDASTGGSAVASDVLSSYMGDVVMIAHSLAVDPAPDVRVAGCTLLMRLCDLAPLVMRFFAVAAVKSIAACGGLDHRHAKVRLASLDAVDALISFHDELKGRGAGTEAILPLTGGREANVVPVSAFYGRDTTVNYFAKLVIDNNPAVRLRFAHALGGWITRLPDRLDWWPYNLPYLLSCLGDDSPAVSSAALDYLEAAGVSHETEHASIIMERSQYGLDGDPEVSYDRPLPHPFSARGRPRVGVRLFVRAHARRFLKPVLAELVDYAPFGVPGGVDTRSRAAALLVAMLVMEEEQATADAHLLVKTLVKGVHDREGSMARHTRTAARLVGRYFDPKSWLPFLLPFISGEAKTGQEDQPGGEVTVVSSALLVLWLALQESLSRMPRVLPHLPAIVTEITSPRVLRLATPPPAFGAGAAAGAGGTITASAVAAAALARTAAYHTRTSTLSRWYDSVGSASHDAVHATSGTGAAVGGDGLTTASAGGDIHGAVSRARQVASSAAADTEPVSTAARNHLRRNLLACISVLSEAVGAARARSDGFGQGAVSVAQEAASGKGPMLNGVRLNGGAGGRGAGPHDAVATPAKALLRLTTTALAVRGLVTLDLAEAGLQDGSQVGAGNNSAQDQAARDKAVRSAVTALKRDDDPGLRGVASAHRWEGLARAGVPVGATASTAIVLAATSELLVMCDEALTRLAVAAGAVPAVMSVEEGKSDGSSAVQCPAAYLPGLRTAGLAQPVQGNMGGLRPVPPEVAALLGLPADLSPGTTPTPSSPAQTLWDSCLLSCLSEYPTNSGWDGRAPQHAVLMQLLDPGVLCPRQDSPSSSSLCASLSARLPMLLDLGSTLVQAAGSFDSSQVVRAGAGGVAKDKDKDKGGNSNAVGGASIAASSGLTPAKPHGPVLVSQREEAWASYLLLLASLAGALRARQAADRTKGRGKKTDASSPGLSTVLQAFTSPATIDGLLTGVLGHGLPTVGEAVASGAGETVWLQSSGTNAMPTPGPHGTPAPSSMLSTPGLASLSATVLAGLGRAGALDSRAEVAQGQAAGTAEQAKTTADTACRLAVILLQRAGATSGSHPVPASERCMAIRGAAAVLSGPAVSAARAVSEASPEPTAVQPAAETSAFACRALQSRLADSDESVALVAAESLGPAVWALGQSCGDLTVGTVVKDCLLMARDMGLRLTDFEGGGMGMGMDDGPSAAATCPAGPTVGDHVLGLLMAVATDDPAAANAAARAFINSLPAAHESSSSGNDDDAEARLGARAMASAVIEHADMMVSLAAGRGEDNNEEQQQDELV